MVYTYKKDKHKKRFEIWIFGLLIALDIKIKDDDKNYPFTNRCEPNYKIGIYTK